MHFRKLIFAVLIIAAGNLFPQQFSLSTDYYNLYRQRSAASDIDLIYRSTELNSTFDLSGTKLSLDFGYTNSAFNWSSNSEGIHNRFESTGKYITGSVHTGYRDLYLNSRMKLNSFSSRLSFDYSLELGLEKFSLSFRKASVPFNWSLMYNSAGFDINTGTAFYAAGVNISENSGNTFIFFRGEKSISGTENLNSRYSTVSKPDFYNLSLKLINKNIKLPFEFTIAKTSISTNSEMRMNSVQFSSLKLLGFYNFSFGGSITPSLHRIPLTLSLNYNLYNGTLIGNAESWPFADIIQSLVENRLNFKLTGKADVLETKASAVLNYGRLSLLPELSVYYIRPDIILESWQPVYLAFGIKNLSLTGDGINQAWLGRIGLTAGYLFSSAEISVKLTQYLPLYTSKENVKTVTMGPVLPSVSNAAGSAKKSTGGTFISVTLKKSF